MIPPLSRTAIVSLRSDVCPHCGGHKSPHKSICFRSWSKLPGFMKQALYRRVGEGYEAALAQALDYLGCKTFITPSEVR